MKFKKWLLPIAALFFLAVFVIRVLQVNTMNPIGGERTVAFGETEISRTGLKYTIADAYFVPYDEMEAEGYGYLQDLFA